LICPPIFIINAIIRIKYKNKKHNNRIFDNPLSIKIELPLNMLVFVSVTIY